MQKVPKLTERFPSGEVAIIKIKNRVTSINSISKTIKEWTFFHKNIFCYSPTNLPKLILSPHFLKKSLPIIRNDSCLLHTQLQTIFTLKKIIADTNSFFPVSLSVVKMQMSTEKLLIIKLPIFSTLGFVPAIILNKRNRFIFIFYVIPDNILPENFDAVSEHDFWSCNRFWYWFSDFH